MTIELDRRPLLVAKIQEHLDLHTVRAVAMENTSGLRRFFLVLLAVAFAGIGGCGGGGSGPASNGANVPADIRAVFNKPLYKGGLWGLRVVDVASGRALIDLRPRHNFLIGSTRKLFSVGALMNQIGPNYTYDTPIYRQGDISAGVLNGNLILDASGDLTMGGRTNPDGTIAVSDYDHNEADALGNAVLTAPDPLAGYDALAQQVNRGEHNGDNGRGNSR